MTIQNRKERERAERHQRIIDAARELAEAQGWEAVTVRRLAERIEYSQPVLYSHFTGKVAIVSAVAEQGFADLAATLHAARTGASNPAAALEEIARAYLEFATDNPARYDAMFVLTTELKFGTEAPKALKDSYGEIAAAYEPFAGANDLETGTEVAWATLHGVATLDRGGRLRPDLREQRIEVLMSQWTAGRE
ncbi:TetR/AcrR family transcriptional regulator [Nocardia sp. NPDC057440]|uniref:TetR/AcrR family transcriptional regulator n=1 Tax=Nocardia sp. NPDC057440 TaxID=3346134 RepID=UPI003672A287